MWVEATGLDHIDSRAEEAFEIRQESAQVKQISSLLQIHQKIDIAVRPVIASGDRPEHAYIASAMLLGQLENGGSLFLPQCFQRYHRFHGYCPRLWFRAPAVLATEPVAPKRTGLPGEIQPSRRATATEEVKRFALHRVKVLSRKIGIGAARLRLIKERLQSSLEVFVNR